MLFKNLFKKQKRFKIQSAERKNEMESRIVKQSLTADKGTTYEYDTTGEMVGGSYTPKQKSWSYIGGLRINH